MAAWNEFVNGHLPYQAYWLPVAIGLVAGFLCFGVGAIVARGRRRAAAATVASAGHDPFVDGSATEKRKSLRRAGNPVTVVFACKDEPVAHRRALVLDRSLGGLRLAAEDDIPQGTELRLLPTNASDQTPWIDLKVISCRQVEDSWELHCQFLKTPPWSVLLLFG